MQSSLSLCTSLFHYYSLLCALASSQDCLEWKILPHVDDGLKRKSSLLQGRFTGDPAYVFEHTITHRVGEGESAQEQTTNVSVNRLLPSARQPRLSRVQ